MNPGFAPDERCLIGVSGGRDSVALLHQLLGAGFKNLIVCHLDHALRPESGADASFVADLAKQHDLEAVIGRQDVAARAKLRRQSIETAARDARYGLFAQTARNHDCPRLFLAHHADDQVETFLFNLFRGSAVAGLVAMQPLSRRKIEGITLEISRPLVGVWREEIDAYVAQHALTFREDASNSDLRHTRNRLRHEIIPAIEGSFGRDIRRAVWRTAEILRAENDTLAALGGEMALGKTLSVETLRALPLAVQRRVIHEWLKRQTIPDVGFENVENVRALLTGTRAKYNLPAGWHVRRRAGEIFVEGSSSE